MTKLWGIDVSNHNQGLVHSRNNKKLDFVIAKASEGDWFSDKWFADYYADAKQQGHAIGAYHFLQATTIGAAKAEADFFLSKIKGKKLDFGLWCDVEAATFNCSKQKATDIVYYFCKYLEDKGNYVGIYTAEHWGFNQHLYWQQLKRFAFWVANWQTRPQIPHVIWQYTSSQNVPGYNIVGKPVCDCNYAYQNLSKAIKNKGLCGYGK